MMMLTQALEPFSLACSELEAKFQRKLSEIRAVMHYEEVRTL
jgi:hypothetical protein